MLNLSEIDPNASLSIIQPEERPTFTYKVDWEKNTIGGDTDRLGAIEQYIYKVLNTERFAFLIYSWNYGFESRLIIGRGTNIAESLVERLIREAVLADSRITEIRDLETRNVDKRTLYVSFTASSIFGDVAIERSFYYGR